MIRETTAAIPCVPSVDSAESQALCPPSQVLTNNPVKCAFLNPLLQTRKLRLKTLLGAVASGGSVQSPRSPCSAQLEFLLG